jgi:hypothetical protein
MDRSDITPLLVAYVRRSLDILDRRQRWQHAVGADHDDPDGADAERIREFALSLPEGPRRRTLILVIAVLASIRQQAGVTAW